jgi:hypothetical protein
MILYIISTMKTCIQQQLQGHQEMGYVKNRRNHARVHRN